MLFFSVYCEEIPPLSHGSIQSSTDGVSSMVTLKCDVGFTLKGAEIAACNDQGKWNESTSAECGIYKLKVLQTKNQNRWSGNTTISSHSLLMTS